MIVLEVDSKYKHLWIIGLSYFDFSKKCANNNPEFDLIFVISPGCKLKVAHCLETEI